MSNNTTVTQQMRSSKQKKMLEMTKSPDS